MRELHLFAGAGGGILGGMLLGHTCVCAVEIEPYRRKVLLQRQRDGIFPKFPIWDDVQTFDGTPWKGKVDIVAGGFPCQGISGAGNGEGLSDPRSGLWREQARVVCEIRPRFVFVENSPMLARRGLDIVLENLAEMGYDARWGVFSAGELGAWHDRPRLWILAFDSHQVRTERSRKCGHAGTPGPWWEISEKHLRETLERPTTDQGSVKPLLCGTDYGMAHWVDQIEAIGDGQVPAVAALAWRVLNE